MKLSPNEIAHVALTVWRPPADLIVPLQEIDAATGVSNKVLAVAIALAESAGDTDAMHMSDDPKSENFGNVDHGVWQMSNRWNGQRLIAMGDWRDPYNNGAMMFDLALEWWRKETRLDYVAAQRKDDPEWHPSMWRAWSVYTSGTAWKVTTAAPKNRFVAMAKFGLANPVAAPRPTYLHRGTASSPLQLFNQSLDLVEKHVADVRRHFA